MIKKIVYIFPFLLAGCSSTQVNYSSVSNTPTISKNSLSASMLCARDIVGDELNPNNRTLALYIRDVTDGTVPKGLGINGPLADSGKIMFSSSLYRLHPSLKQLFVMDSFPTLFSDELSSSGYPGTEESNKLFDTFKKDFSSIRKANGLTTGKTNVFVVDAAFTRFDEKGFSSGYGSNIEYDKNSTAEISFGENKEKKYMSLTVNIINPFKNIIVGSETFDLMFTSGSSERGFSINRSGLSSGLSMETVEIESIHSAQQTLVDYAALWMITEFSQKDINKCLPKDEGAL